MSEDVTKPANSRRLTGPYAGAVCPKCGQGMNHKQNITLSEQEEARDKKRYGRGICDDCKLERQQKEGNKTKTLNNMSDFKERLLAERQELSTKISKLGEFINSDKITTVGDNQRRFLNAQYHAMITYETILSCRINDLELVG